MGGEGKWKGKEGKGRKEMDGEERGRWEVRERKGGAGLAYSRRLGPRKT